MINLKPKEFLIHQTSSTEHGINTNYYPSLNEGISLKIFCFPGCSSPAFGNSSPHACSHCVFHVIPKEKQIRHVQGIRYQVPPQDSKNPQIYTRFYYFPQLLSPLCFKSFYFIFQLPKTWNSLHWKRPLIS